MTAPLDVSGAAIEAQPEAGLAGLEAKAVEGRSLGQIAWLRLQPGQGRDGRRRRRHLPDRWWRSSRR